MLFLGTSRVALRRLGLFANHQQHFIAARHNMYSNSTRGAGVFGSVARLEENIRAVDVSLTDSDIARIEQVLPKAAAAGARYYPVMLDLVVR